MESQNIYGGLPKATPEQIETERKLDHAHDNAILESRLDELEQELEILEDKFIHDGTRSEVDIQRELEIEKEILRSAAVSNSLGEYKDMLAAVAYDCGLPKEWVEETLNHENSHANVSEHLGHEWVGNAVIYVKDSLGNISHIQPVHISRPKTSWGPKEVLLKRIEVTSAPERSESSLSVSDINRIETDKAKLRKIQEREEADQIALTEVQKRLGILKK